MKIDIPWSIGDECYAVYIGRVDIENYCEHCHHTEKKEKLIREIRPAKVCGINIIVNPAENKVQPPTIIAFYICDFNGHSMNVGKKLWLTREEAEQELKG